MTKVKEIRNVRIGLGGELYRINKDDIPLVKKFLRMVADTS